MNNGPHFPKERGIVMSQTLTVPYAFPLLMQAPKRQVFISHFGDNVDEVDAFIRRWSTLEGVFTPKALGTFHNEDFINSNDTEYVMSEIRRKYLDDSSVTILLIGKCTHSRRYVDWELKSSLRRGSNVPNGLLAYVLPSAMPSGYGPYGEIPWDRRAWPHIPDRLADNWNYYQQDQSYARYFVIPASAEELRQQIENAVWDRTNRAHLIRNDRIMMGNNHRCRVCGVFH
jgi:hypothetical protein